MVLVDCRVDLVIIRVGMVAVAVMRYMSDHMRVDTFGARVWYFHHCTLRLPSYHTLGHF